MKLAQLAVAAAFVPVINGLRQVRALSTGQRALLLWLGLGAALDIAQFVLGRNGQETLFMSTLAYPVFGFAACEALGRLSDSRVFLRAARYAALIYAVGWVFAQAVLEDNHWFTTFTGPGLYLMLALVAGGLVFIRFRQHSEISINDAAVLAALATLLSYAPGAALEPASKVLYATHKSLDLALWEARAGLLILGSVFYALALQWNQRRTS